MEKNLFSSTNGKKIIFSNCLHLLSKYTCKSAFSKSKLIWIIKTKYSELGDLNKRQRQNICNTWMLTTLSVKSFQ